MKLQDAKPCLNCEEIYVGPVCPKCATPHCVFVTNWIQSLENNDNAKMLRNIIYGREEVHNAVRRFHVEREGESREIFNTRLLQEAVLRRFSIKREIS